MYLNEVMDKLEHYNNKIFKVKKKGRYSEIVFEVPNGLRDEIQPLKVVFPSDGGKYPEYCIVSKNRKMIFFTGRNKFRKYLSEYCEKMFDYQISNPNVNKTIEAADELSKCLMETCRV